MKRARGLFKPYFTSGLIVLLIAIASHAVSSGTPKFVYVTNSGGSSVSAYTINSTTGALSMIGGSPFPTGSVPLGVVVDPSGKFAYVANSGESSVSAYAINSTTGALSPIRGSPFAAGSRPGALAVDPSGRFIYVANLGSTNVSAYTINSTTGALSPVGGSPFAAGTRPYAVAIDPSGKFAYVVNNISNNVSAYNINSVTGALSPVSGSPFSTGSAPIAVVVDPSGKFAYVANNNSNSLSVYTINSTTGSLSPISGSPFATGHIPFGVTIAGQSPVPFAAFMVEGDIALVPPGTFAVNGNFTLGAGSNGINPLTEGVVLQVGNIFRTIPAGSFISHPAQPNGRASFTFQSEIDSLDVRITQLDGVTFQLQAEGEGASLTRTGNPPTVSLTIGDDGGSAPLQ